MSVERPQVLIDLVEGNATRISVRPLCYLGGLWPLFHDALKAANAGYSKTLHGYVTSLDRVLEVERRLASVRNPLSVAVSPRCAEALFMVANEHRKRALRAEDFVEELKGSGLSLFPYQLEGAAILSVSKAWLLLDEQGLGKTVQALTAAPKDLGLLVVAPASAKFNWLGEAKRWRGTVFGGALQGRGSFRWPMPGEVVVLNYDILPRAEEFDVLGPLARVPKICLVIDEVHNAKNPGTKNKPVARTERIRALAQGVLNAGGYAWGLTGTPMTNQNPKELWTVAELFGLAVRAFGTKARLEAAFRERGAVAEMLRTISTRRERKDVLPDLPTKIYRTIDVENIGQAAKMAADEVITQAEKAGIDIAAQKDFAWIRKIGGHIMTARRLLAEAKTAAAEELVREHEEEGEPVVLFSAHRYPIDKFGKRPGWETITGDTPAEERTRIVRDFQAGKLRGVAATIDAGGVAITLTRAHVAVFVDLEWTPAANSQAEDRVCRIGQDRGVVIVRLVANHKLEHRIFAILAGKAAAIEKNVEKSALQEGQALARDVEVATRYEALAKRATELAPWQAAEPVKPKPAAPVPAAAAPAPGAKPRRMAKTAKEAWVMRALLTIAGLDKDPEARRNGQGFSRGDFEFGHRLAGLIPTGGLTEKQWDAAALVVARYPRQVGAWEEKAS